MRETNHWGAELALHQPFLAPDDERPDIILYIILDMRLFLAKMNVCRVDAGSVTRMCCVLSRERCARASSST